MKIKNKSIKPIGFGTINVLPGTTATVPDSYAEAVEFYKSIGYMEDVKETTKATAKKNSSKAAAADQPEDKAGES